MNEQRRSGHTVTRFIAHLVWVMKYRYPVLKGDVQPSTELPKLDLGLSVQSQPMHFQCIVVEFRELYFVCVTDGDQEG